MFRDLRSLLLPLALIGCHAETSTSTSVTCAGIPVYPGARLSSEMGGSTSESLDGPVESRSHSWFFDCADARASVAQFYRDRLPDCVEEDDEDEDELRFHVVSAGARDGEEVIVTLRDRELQITQVTVPAGP